MRFSIVKKRGAIRKLSECVEKWEIEGLNIESVIKTLQPYLCIYRYKGEKVVKLENKPYGGLFGDTAQIKIIEEIVAYPYRSYRPHYFEEMTGASAPSIRKALNTLTSLGLIDKDTGDIQHPIYRANLKSKKLVALTFLSLASIDDRDGTECMDFAILDYYFKVLNEKVQPLAAATAMKFEFKGMQFTVGYVSEGEQTLRESAPVAAKVA